MNKYMFLRILSLIISVSLLAGCAKSSLPTSTQVPSGAYSAAAPTQTPAAPASNTNAEGACTLLTQADVAKALGLTIDSAVESGLGGTCTYSTTDLTIELTFSHTGGIKSVQTTLANLGELAILVPGLGDQAFINTNVNTLFVLKGDAIYLINVSDSSYKLTVEDRQAMEKSIAEQLLQNLS